ncbi:MATE family multidrug resistance protein [Dongia mobilis]|uniref:MATE family multidrug resistance protein n=1 Tax=Dongia mobilis TaxID=578943 RepID=A0A4R6WST3_9PROT|nr:MATE family efflux transporter [Dongia mobilis]TDQ84596.1 MATE family multidrug resistance protein [Dongia mobilis]
MNATATTPTLGIGHHFRRTVQLALPVMAARAGLVIMLSVNAIFCGWQGKEVLAAFGAAAVPQVTLMVVGVGLLIGTIILTAQADGAGNHGACGRALAGGLVIAAGFGTFCAALLLPAEYWLDLLGQPVETIPAASDALRILGYSLPAILMFTACSFFLEGINRPLPGMIATLAANLLNLLLNWVFVLGNLGAPEMGAAGSALATSITRFFMLAGMLGYILTMPGRDRYLRPGWLRVDAATLRRLIVLGLPLAFAIGAETGCFNFMVVMAGWLGTAELATMYAAINYTSFVYMLTLGLSTAASVRVGNAIGRRNAGDIRRAGWIAVGLEFAVMAAIATLTIFLAPRIASLYSQDPAVLGLLVPALNLTALLFLVDGLQGVLMGALRGTADTLVPTAVYIVSFAFVGIPMGYFLGYQAGMGVPALIWALVAALALATLGLGARFHWVSRRQEGLWR